MSVISVLYLLIAIEKHVTGHTLTACYLAAVIECNYPFYEEEMRRCVRACVRACAVRDKTRGAWRRKRGRYSIFFLSTILHSLTVLYAQCPRFLPHHHPRIFCARERLLPLTSSTSLFFSLSREDEEPEDEGVDDEALVDEVEQ